MLGLPELLQHPHWHGDAVLENIATEVGHRHLPLPHQSQERVEHEAPPRSQGHAEDGLVGIVRLMRLDPKHLHSRTSRLQGDATRPGRRLGRV